MRSRFLAAAVAAASILAAAPAFAEDGEHFWSGDWYLKVGGAGFVAPRYEGARAYLLQGSPMISLGRPGKDLRFTSRNDNASFALLDSGAIRAGLVGKLVMPRSADDDDDLKGLAPVKLGLEAGAFAEAYPTDNIRLRAEIRRGIRSHDGVVADLSADGFVDLTPTVRLSAGPRLTLASEDYQDTYYKVSRRRADRSGLSRFDADGGLHSAGIGAAITWQATENIEASTFAEYKRLLGDAAKSSLVQERGTPDQFVLGISTSYKFGFTLP